MNDVKATKLMKGLIEKFLQSISDEKVVEAIREGYVAGGAIPALLRGDYLNDLDIYLTTHNHVKCVKAYFTREWVSIKHDDEKAVNEYQQKNFYLTLITENSINFSSKIQIITKWYGKYQDVVELFDFEHLKAVYSIKDERMYIPMGIYPLLLNKELVYTGSMFPLSSLLRLRKFLKRGWTISTKDMIRIVLETHSYLTKSYNKSTNNLNTTAFYDGLTDVDIRNIYDYKISQMIDVNEFYRQLNGVDPLTIQVELKKHFGKILSIKEIMNLI